MINYHIAIIICIQIQHLLKLNYVVIVKPNISFNSNTTLVKVKLKQALVNGETAQIQIQHLLKLNSFYQASSLKTGGFKYNTC